MISILAALIIGILLVRSIFPEPGGLLLIACGAAIGLGIDSILFFLFTAAGVANIATLAAAQLILIAASLWFYRRRLRPKRQTAESLSTPTRIAAIVLAVESVLMLASFVNVSRINPHGEWDAWSIWNVRARYLTGDWHCAVSKDIILQHPDYPLLTSSVIAHAWETSRSLTTAVPIAVALLFLAITVLALASALRPLPAFCAAAMLLAIPGWTRLAAAQYADVPLGAYFLCSVALLCASRNDHRLAVLAGVALSFSAWTKDEGLLFSAILLSIALLFFGRKRALLMLAGAAPVLLFVVWFKLGIAPGVEPLWRQTPAAISAKVLDLTRYARIAAQYVKDAAAMPQLLLLPLFSVALGFRPSRETVAGFAIPGLMFAGYFLYYVVTPYPLKDQLSASLDRLFIQLLPAFLFAWFHASSWVS